MTDRSIMDELDAQTSSSRAPRKTREQSERPKVWQPASLLPEPDQQPGYSYRWIRVASAGKADGQNLMSKRREGWEPVEGKIHLRRAAAELEVANRGFEICRE